MKVVQCRLESADQLARLVDLPVMDGPGLKHGYVFRGQSAKFPALAPKADRLGIRDSFTYALTGARNDLKHVQHQYRRVIHNVQPSLPPQMTWMEWQAMVQHYGGPTRLLDVTASPLVAAYFACRDADAEQGAFIWCLRSDVDRVVSMAVDMRDAIEVSQDEPLDDEEAQAAGQIAWQAAEGFLFSLWDGDEAAQEFLRSFHEADPKVMSKLAAAVPAEDRNVFNRAKLLDPFGGVVFVRPYRLNARLLAQQGAFAMVINNSTNFMDCLVPDQNSRSALEAPDWSTMPSLADCAKQIESDEPEVLRIWLPANVVREVDQVLPRYNITGFSLFPDFDGFTQTLNDVHRLYRGI